VILNSVLHKSETRGDANHGWLHSRHTFSFADYNIKAKGNGVYAFILSGTVTINNQELNSRDGFSIRDIDKLSVKADTDADFLLMEVPMK
jgi:redox-sensitive bicupin YhaK (pirin superfamily)